MVTRFVLEEEVNHLKNLLVGLISNPPPDGFKVTNIYLDSDERVVLEYSVGEEIRSKILVTRKNN